MTKEKHITILAVLHIARGALLLIIGLLGFIILSGIGLIAQDPTALGVLGLIGTVAIIFFGVIALPSVIAGIGLLKHQEWGRILALVVGFLSLLDIPIGTALGVYTIVILMDDEARRIFLPDLHPQPSSTPSPSP
jgi:hypothetical protein